MISCVLGLTACSVSWRTASETTTGADVSAAGPPLQAEDLVDLTLYLRGGEGPDAHLTPVTREVALTEDLPRLAVELLIAGPVTGEETLSAPLPVSTEIREVSVEDATATVDLSAHVIEDAARVGNTPTNEALALGALVNTLTEFPSIERVKLRVEGLATGARGEVDPGAFWGGWGLPALLVRDHSLVGTPAAEGEGVPDITLFSGEEQTIGIAGAPPIEVARVRARDLLTHVRFVIELGERDGGQTEIPPARAVREGDAIRLTIKSVSGLSPEFEESIDSVLDSPGLESVRVERGEISSSLEVVAQTTGDRDFRLHTRATPARIILDIRK